MDASVERVRQVLRAEEDRIIVIGAGIVGLCCGLSMLEKGLKVTLIDKGEPGQATSYGNAGVVSPWSNVPQCIPGVWKGVPKWLLSPTGPVRVRPRDFLKVLPWALRFLSNADFQTSMKISDAMSVLNNPNIDIYRQHLRGTGEEDLLQEALYVHVFRDVSKINLQGPAWRLRARQNVPIEVVSKEELHEIEPDLSPAYQAAILIKGQARLTSPGRLGAVLAEKITRRGGSIIRSNVTGIGTDEARTWTVQTETGQHRARKLVIAAGAWSTKLLKPLGIHLPLQTERGYHMMFKDPGVSLNNSIMETDRLFICSSMSEGIRSAGTSEFSDIDAPANYQRAKVLSKMTKDLLPNLNTQDTMEWVGNRPSFPDNLPCIDEIKSLPGLLVAFGHSHWGMGMAPKTGQIIADLVSDTPLNINLAPYSADRFR